MDGTSTTSTTNAVNSPPPPFLSKTYDMVDDPSTNLVVSWSNGNNSFVVWSVPAFATELLPKYFKHNNFSSFVRQLNTYGFRKVDPDRWEFANEGFLRGQKHLLKTISRRKPAHVQSQQQKPQVQSTTVGACVEVGKFGIEEEVERLKRDKNVLMQELVRLRQQQQGTDHQLQTVGQRVQVMEQRQQQMMSFLAKAMQSPGFLAQLVQQHNDSNMRIVGSTKKRRFSKQDEENSEGGRIIKYQPLMNEAAKAMMRQILKMNASPQLDHQTLKNPDAFLIDDVQTPCNTLSSGVTLSEVPLTTRQPSAILAADSGFSVNNISFGITEMHSSPQFTMPEPCISAQFSQTNVADSEENLLFTEEIISKSCVESPDVNLSGADFGNGGYRDPRSLAMDGTTMPLETEGFSSDPEVDILLDETPKLPGIDDVFWEQFLTASPLSGDNTDEIDPSEMDLEGVVFQEHEFEPTHRMNQLTEQMGLLASEAKKG